MFVLSKELIEHIEENTDYSVEYNKGDEYVEFSRYSSKGQDFRFDICLKNMELIGDFLLELYTYYNDFDVSEETALWIDEFGHGKNGAPYELEDVLDDMKECEKSIMDLYDVINDFENPKKCYANPDYKDYYVALRITGAYLVKVPGDSIEDALKRADNEFIGADFGELEDVEYVPMYIEDENGNRVWNKEE